jgi:hypothetical protein
VLHQQIHLDFPSGVAGAVQQVGKVVAQGLFHEAVLGDVQAVPVDPAREGRGKVAPQEAFRHVAAGEGLAEEAVVGIVDGGFHGGA